MSVGLATRSIAVIGAAMLATSSLAWPATAAPGEGNSGKKTIVNEVLGPFPGAVDCGDVQLDVTVHLKEQYLDKAHGKNTQVATFSNRIVYANPAGDTWTHQDRGSNRYYEEDGVAVTAVSGRSGFGPIGHVVFETTDEGDVIVHQAGRWIDIDAEACARLS